MRVVPSSLTITSGVVSKSNPKGEKKYFYSSQGTITTFQKQQEGPRNTFWTLLLIGFMSIDLSLIAPGTS